MNNCIALSSILLIISLAVSISKADIYDGCSLGINCIAVPRSDLGSGSDTEEKCGYCEIHFKTSGFNDPDIH